VQIDQVEAAMGLVAVGVELAQAAGDLAKFLPGGRRPIRRVARGDQIRDIDRQQVGVELAGDAVVLAVNHRAGQTGRHVLGQEVFHRVIAHGRIVDFIHQTVGDVV